MTLRLMQPFASTLTRVALMKSDGPRVDGNSYDGYDVDWRFKQYETSAAWGAPVPITTILLVVPHGDVEKAREVAELLAHVFEGETVDVWATGQTNTPWTAIDHRAPNPQAEDPQYVLEAIVEDPEKYRRDLEQNLVDGYADNCGRGA
jgi:hypothetical protein